MAVTYLHYVCWCYDSFNIIQKLLKMFANIFCSYLHFCLLSRPILLLPFPTTSTFVPLLLHGKQQIMQHTHRKMYSWCEKAETPLWTRICFTCNFPGPHTFTVVCLFHCYWQPTTTDTWMWWSFVLIPTQSQCVMMNSFMLSYIYMGRAGQFLWICPQIT